MDGTITQMNFRFLSSLELLRLHESTTELAFEAKVGTNKSPQFRFGSMEKLKVEGFKFPGKYPEALCPHTTVFVSSRYKRFLTPGPSGNK